VDLPTYTNIWRIEKRLYKLYDFRLPAPLPITWIGVFVGITVPYVFFLIAVGLPFNHNLVWLYILPPGVLTWLTTRPVIESKRLPELMGSQLRYVAEPRSWCRMAPFAEKNEILVTARVWHQHPPKARSKKAKRPLAEVRPSAPQLAASGAEETAQAGVRSAKAGRAVAWSLAAPQTSPPPTLSPAVAPVVSPAAEPVVAPLPEQVPEQVPERAPARWAAKRAKAEPKARPSWSPWPHGPEPDTASTPDAGQAPETDQRPAWATSPPAEMLQARALEVAHDSDPGLRGPGSPPASFGPASWPSPEVNLLPLVRPRPEPAPFPDAGAFPDAGPFPDGPFPDAGPFPEADTEPGPAADAEPEGGVEQPEAGGPAAAFRSGIASARRHLSGLMPSPGRKPDRSADSSRPAAEASGQTASAGPETAADIPRPRPRWMLQVQARPASTPIEDLLWPTEPPPAEPSPAEPAPAVPALAVPALAAPAPAELAPAELAAAELAPAELAPVAPEAAPQEAQDPQAEAPPPVTEVPAPQVQAPNVQVPEAGEPEARKPETQEPAAQEPAPEKPAPEEPVSPVLAGVVGLEREPPRPSIERALSGPGSGEELSWRRQVKVVAGGQGPGKRDREALDRDRARTPLAGPRRIVVLGCTRGAGQTLTALMTSHILATVRGIPVAALDLNPGPTSLAARRSPAVSIDALLASQPGDDGDPGPGARLDVIGRQPGHGRGNNGYGNNGHGNNGQCDNGQGDNGQGNDAAHALDGDDFRRLADVLAERYLLTMIDPAASGLTRVLSAADLLVLVAPASPDAPTSLANTQQWLGAHGHGELAGRAVTVVNGVSRRTRDDVLRAESVARGRCRAIVRVPWDDLLSSHPGTHRQTTLEPPTRLAYTALAGVLVTGLAGAAPSPSRGAVTEGNPGEHAD
jgi:hypothetical protein